MPLINRVGGGGAKLHANKNVTPGTSPQYITPDSGYDGMKQVTVWGDYDLIPGNIKKGVEIFGVAGEYGAEEATIETCSVKISAPNYAHIVVTATVFKDGKIEAYSYHGDATDTPHIIDDVICGSTVTAHAIYSSYIFSCGNGVEAIDTSYANSFKAPQTAGAVGTINIMSNT